MRWRRLRSASHAHEHGRQLCLGDVPIRSRSKGTVVIAGDDLLIRRPPDSLGVPAFTATFRKSASADTVGVLEYLGHHDPVQVGVGGERCGEGAVHQAVVINILYRVEVPCAGGYVGNRQACLRALGIMVHFRRIWTLPLPACAIRVFSWKSGTRPGLGSTNQPIYTLGLIVVSSKQTLKYCSCGRPGVRLPGVVFFSTKSTKSVPGAHCSIRPRLISLGLGHRPPMCWTVDRLQIHSPQMRAAAGSVLD